jgi:acyl-CoA reductase-like NAD-dependent aldehyde dehydrogenase
MGGTATPGAGARPLSPVPAPGRGGLLGVVPDLSESEVDALVARARAAQPAWAALGVGERARILGRLRRLLVRRRRQVVDLLQDEGGKPYEDAHTDLLLVLVWLEHWCRVAPGLLADERIDSASPFAFGRRNVVTYEPLGVVGVIGPWNVPLSLTLGDAVPALLAGNTVVLKPSELTPLSARFAAELFLEAGGPPDVLLAATGGAETGSALVDRVDYVHFTGSVATGRLVAQRAAASLTPCSLELGGKDAMLVLDDADLERAARGCVAYALVNSGQICMSVERVYVESGVHDEFVERVVREVKALRQGTPGGPGSVELGAMIHPPQRDVVAEHVGDALRRGARAVVGGLAEDGSACLGPTVLVDVDHSMTCMREETFGPTIPIMRVDGEDEAVALANDSEYGLTASVWTRDLDRGERLARRLEVGTVTVNDAMVHLAVPEMPMGGWKSSGVGARNGADGLRRFTRRRAIQIPRWSGARELSWFPYRAPRTRALGAVVAARYGRLGPRTTRRSRRAGGRR